jgi:hypothetical protein
LLVPLEIAMRNAHQISRLRVAVCLQKRLGRRTFSVRCQTGSGAGRRVSAEVGVPGCVERRR